MGQTKSNLPIKPLSPNHFCITSHAYNRSFITAIGIHNTHPVHQQIQDAIKSISEKCGEMKKYNDEPNVVKFTAPVEVDQSFSNSLRLKLMWSAIFFNLLKIGWRVRLATDVQRYGEDSTFIFEYVVNKSNYRGTPEAIACVSVSSTNKLHLISKECFHQALNDDMQTLNSIGNELNSIELK